MKIKRDNKGEIDKAMAVLKKYGYIQCYWHIDDIIQRDSENEDSQDDPALDEQDALKIARHIEKIHDANIGINWEVIDQAIVIFKQ